MRTVIALAAFLWAGTARAAPVPDPTLEQAIKDVYAPYAVTMTDGSYPPTSWQRPIYTREVKALIDRWESVMPEEEVDDLNDGDWLCLCQDWDSRAFKATIASTDMEGADVARVVVDVAVFGTEAQKATLDMKREDGAWKIDEMTSEAMPKGLKQALRDTIAKDEAL